MYILLLFFSFFLQFRSLPLASQMVYLYTRVYAFAAIFVILDLSLRLFSTQHPTLSVSLLRTHTLIRLLILLHFIAAGYILESRVFCYTVSFFQAISHAFPSHLFTDDLFIFLSTSSTPSTNFGDQRVYSEKTA